MNLRTLIPAAAALALCLGACSNDDTRKGEPSPGIIDDGEPASLTLSISKPVSEVTRAEDVDNATADEVKFVSADIFIYADNSLVKHARLYVDDFTDDGKNVWTTTEPIATTTGAKEIYVGVNMPVGLANAIAAAGNKSGMRIEQNVTDYSLINDAGTLLSGQTGDCFVMFSTQPETLTLRSDAEIAQNGGSPNKISAKVARLVAKVTVEEGEKLNLKIPGGELTGLQFAIRNSNRLFFPYQKDGNGNIVDPNHYDGSFNPAHFEQYSDYVAVDAYNTPVLSREVKYTPENTTEKTYTGETTYASVKAAFIPDKFADDEGVLYDNTNGAPATFYLVTIPEDGSVLYFEDKDDAIDYSTDNGLDKEDIKEYANGLCYYNLFLNPKNDYQTLRNNLYQCRITSIIGLGNPNPGDGGEEEDKQVTRPANLDVEIDILPWGENEDDYELF